MVDFVGILSQIIFATSILIIASLGLAIIFGMMGVINLAHGALITAGAYAAFAVTNAGFSLWTSDCTIALSTPYSPPGDLPW